MMVITGLLLLLLGWAPTWASAAGIAAVEADLSQAPPPPLALTRTRRQRVELFRRAGVSYPAHQLYLRVFKAEEELELWAGDRGEPLRLIKTYAICASSGVLGPKRRLGDQQVPEGFYEVTRMRRYTRFFRSLRINYPNRADRLKGRTGGAILIHGKCVTVGCIPLTDPPVGELFEVAVDARRRRKRKIAVHIFPRRMNQEGMQALARDAAQDPELLRFWHSLRPAYRAFGVTREVPRFKISARGDYQVQPPGE